MLVMKKILVPTDFSDCSAQAILYANDFAKALGNAEIHLIHCAVLGKLSTTSDSAGQKLYSEVVESLEESDAIFNEFLTQFEFDVPVRYVTFEGSVEKGVRTYARLNNIDQIIIGTHGASGLKEWAIGSNAQKLLRRSNCPVIAVKKYDKPLKLERILFVSNFKNEVLPLYEYAIDIAKSFNAEMHLINIDTPANGLKLPLGEIEQMREFAKHYDGESKIHSGTAWSVERGVKKAIDQYDIDMVVMAHHGQSGFKYHFVSSVTEGVVNHLDIPVLTSRVGVDPTILEEERFVSFREL